MADYRALRQRYSLLEICREPELAVAVTLQPVDVIDVDAAILFSDLLLPFTPMGLDFDFVKGEGPSIDNPIRSAADVDRLRTFEPREALGYVLETIRLLRKELDGRVPLIGFGGAPFTLAAYAIEGGPSTSYAKTKAFMYSQPAAWHRLCETFADDDGGLPEGAGRSRRAGGPGVRLVGRRARPRRLPRVRAAPHDADLRGARRRGRPADSLRRRHDRDPARHRRGRRRRDRRRLAPAARRSVGGDRPRPRHPGQPGSDAAARARGSDVRGRGRRAAARAAGGRATSSTSVTACCRTRRSSTCRRSRGTCTSRRPDTRPAIP